MTSSSSSRKRHRPVTITQTLTPGGFNDAATADVLLRLHVTDSAVTDDVDLHLHTAALRRSTYFAALLSDRWRPAAAAAVLTLPVPGDVEPHLAVLRLLYTANISNSINSVADALDFLPIALQLLFDDCIDACLKFLEAVPWSEEEEEAVLNIIPLLNICESQSLLARLSPDSALPEEMLFKLVKSAFDPNAKIVTNKVLVTKLLEDYCSREAVQRVLDRAFIEVLEKLKQAIGEYASPVYRMGDQDEIEAIRKLKLHAALLNSRHLLWLLERMVELRVADNAVKEWSEQAGLAGDLEKVFGDDAWKNVTPGLPALVMRCTGRLASAVAAGFILAPRQVRMNLVKDWLRVLNACRDTVTSISCQKSPYQELEEAFLKIISTLPMQDAKELLLQCLPLSTRNVDDCPHLISAYNTWFRRANRPRLDIPGEVKLEDHD